MVREHLLGSPTTLLIPFWKYFGRNLGFELQSRQKKPSPKPTQNSHFGAFLERVFFLGSLLAETFCEKRFKDYRGEGLGLLFSLISTVLLKLVLLLLLLLL